MKERKKSKRKTEKYQKIVKNRHKNKRREKLLIINYQKA